MVRKGTKIGKMDKAEKVSLSITGSVLDAVKVRAEAEGRTLSNMVTVLLKDAIKKAA